MNIKDLKGQKVAFLASGGLDSCTVTRWLADNGVRVFCFTADLGQPDETDISDVKKRMLACGAEDLFVIDAKNELVNEGLNLIQAQAYYEGKYWNTTGIARHVTTKLVLPEIKKLGIKILSHGATGRGNDQVRFQLVTNMLAPEVEVYAPWRDENFLKTFGGRKEMIDFCNKNNLPIKATLTSPYSTDANILGLTHEAGMLEELSTPAHFITPGMGVLPINAPNKPQEFSIKFKNGIPFNINGTDLTLLECFQKANKIGGENGIGIAFHVVENRFVGIKSRGVYESPGMELVGNCYQFLLQLIADKRAKDLYDHLSLFLSKQVYQGFYYDSGSQMALAAIKQIAKLVTGTITVSCYKGNISFLSAENVINSLYSSETASMENVGTYNHTDSQGFLNILGVSARALSYSGQINKI